MIFVRPLAGGGWNEPEGRRARGATQMATHEGRVLLGWMERDEAVHWLMKGCVFEPALTDVAAEQLWRGYRDRVEQLPPRAISSLKRLKLNKTEQNIAERFLTALKAKGATHLKVIKIDPLGLVVRQLYVNTDKADEHRAAQSGSRASFVRACLPTDRPAANVNVELRPPGYCIPLPHAEFQLAYVLNAPVTTFLLQQTMNYVSVTEHGGRTVLWAGYHRSYGFAAMLQEAGLAQDAPELTERSLVAALDVNVPVSPREATLVTGLRAPLLGDFLDDRFFMAVKLRKKRYELQVSARIEWIDA
jgi:hypothetical protein